jgi:dihydrofolate synthase / folylpolyglutamate synthase
MHRLSTALGMPQHRFASVHVVGTNGKSSVTRMTAALLEAHGLATGACVSPHPARWAERILIRGERIGEAPFAAAVERAWEGAANVNRTLAQGEAVTQFELATAAAFVAFASARVDVAVIEAGLGGRLDATNTIPSRVTVLTSVGLDHTKWLGESELEIAAEKLAVLRDHSILVLGRVSAEVAELARRTAAERAARLVEARDDPGEEIRLRAVGGFQRRNFALAIDAAEAFLGRMLEPGRVAEVAASLTIPGRLERIVEDPPVYLDVAHNPQGARAIAEALTEINPQPPRRNCDLSFSGGQDAVSAGGGGVVGCLAILRDKDAEAMIAALAPALGRAVCTELGPRQLAARAMPGAESHPAAELAAAFEAAGVEADAIPDFGRALEHARRLAAGPPAVPLVVTGSHYVLSPARAALCDH